MGTSKPCLLALTLAALALAASLQLGSAQPVYGDTPSPPFDPNDPDAAYLFGFPFCRCSDYRCGTTPYKMMRFSEQTLANGNYQVCFNFQDVGCQSGNACCDSILRLMDKIEIQAGERLGRGWVGAAARGRLGPRRLGTACRQAQVPSSAQSSMSLGMRLTIPSAATAPHREDLL